MRPKYVKRSKAPANITAQAVKGMVSVTWGRERISEDVGGRGNSLSLLLLFEGDGGVE